MLSTVIRFLLGFLLLCLVLLFISFYFNYKENNCLQSFTHQKTHITDPDCSESHHDSNKNPGGFFMHLWELEQERLFNFLNF